MATHSMISQRMVRIASNALLYAGFCVGLSTGGSTVYAQQSRQEVNPQTGAMEKSAPSVFVAPDENNRILPGDTLNIIIDDAPELSKLYRVAADGTIVMPPPLGQMNIKRQTTDRLSRKIAAVLLKEDYLKKPQVNISIAQYYADSYYVQGAVRSPGVFLVRQQPSLLTLITLAGGLAENYGSQAIILRPVKNKASVKESAQQQADVNLQANLQGEASTGQGAQKEKTPAGQGAQKEKIKEAAEQEDSDPLPEEAEETVNDDYEMIRLNLSNMINKGRFEQNFKIEPGDIINIPVANVFYVAGEVTAPGSFKLKDGTTLRQAISLAQGTTFKAKLGEAVIFRDDSQTGKRQEVKVDVAAVMSGKKEDIPILANDIIIIPNSRMKSVGGSLLMAFGANAARLPIR